MSAIRDPIHRSRRAGARLATRVAAASLGALGAGLLVLDAPAFGWAALACAAAVAAMAPGRR